jgi:hypothetical protein
MCSITKAAFSDGVREGTENFRLFDSGEVVKEGVIMDANDSQVFLISRPSANLLCIGAFNHGFTCS